MSAARVAYTSKELGSIFEISQQAIDKKSKVEKWASCQICARGGGNEWLVSSMPAKTKERLALALLRQETPQDDVDAEAFAGVAEKTRKIAYARLMILREVIRMGAIVGTNNAIEKMVDASRNGDLSPALQMHIFESLACKKGAQAVLTRRTLYRWHADYKADGAKALVPGKRTAEPTPAWFSAFLDIYQVPQKPTISDAYNEFCKVFCASFGAKGQEPPSIYAVRRLLNKMAKPELLAGRHTGNALLRLRPYKRRNTEELWPTDVYTADGTTFDAEILHPYTGQPFKPEITAVLDVATRRCVGVSIGLSESALTVLDALRMSCCFGGIPAMLYTDGGPGYINKLMLDDKTGLMQRLGIEAAHSIPGRPQGKGLMERAVKTLWVSAAQSLASYTGALMDGDAAHKNFKLSRKAVKQNKRSILPTWDEFKAHILARVDAYNNTPHRGLPRTRDAAGKFVHYSPNEFWQGFVARGFKAVEVPEALRFDLFMPGERRKVRQGWVEFYKGKYFAHELAEFHGDYIEIRYDIWDSSRVWCWTLDGRKICEAALEGNTAGYFPLTRVEDARIKREKAQLARLEDKIQRVVPGATVHMPLDFAEASKIELADSTQPALPEILPLDTADTADAAAQEAPEPVIVRPTLFTSRHDRYVWCMENKNFMTDTDKEFLPLYAQSEEYADLADLYAAKGIAYTL